MNDTEIQKLLELEWGRRLIASPPQPQEHYEQTIDLRSEFKAGLCVGYEHQVDIIEAQRLRIHALTNSLESLVVAIEWEVPAIRDDVQVLDRLDIITKKARESREILFYEP